MPYKKELISDANLGDKCLLKVSTQENLQQKEGTGGLLNLDGCKHSSHLHSYSWHIFLRNFDFGKSAWHKQVEQLIPIGHALYQAHT